MLESFHAQNADWRQQLKQNETKTRLIILTFVLIYASIGFIIDTIILQASYPRVGLEVCFYALISGQVFPIATSILLAIAGVSLWITYTLGDRLMLLGTTAHEITREGPKTHQEQQLINVVEEMKVAAGLQFMPKVYLINADYMNAFASGLSEKSAMVAITRGLLEKLDRAELQAVMAHELSHIRHHDMKVTLTVAVLTNLMLVVVDMLFYSLFFAKDDRRDNRLLLVVSVLRYVLPLMTLVLALFLNRTREFMADAGAVELTRSNEPMARALLKISQDHAQNQNQYVNDYGRTPHEQLRQAAYLFDPSAIDPIKSMSTLFSTHPSLEARLRALGFKRKINTV